MSPAPSWSGQPSGSVTKVELVLRGPDGSIEHAEDVHPDDFVCLADVAFLWEVSRQRVSQLTKRDDFPEPVTRTRAGAIWLRRDIESYGTHRAKRARKHRGVSARVGAES